MLAGSLAILGVALLDAAFSVELPRFVSLLVVGSGYAGLMIGFFLALRSRRPTSEPGKEAEDRDAAV